MSWDEWLKREPAEAVMGRHVEQPAPVANERPAVWPLVIMDMAIMERDGR